MRWEPVAFGNPSSARASAGPDSSVADKVAAIFAFLEEDWPRCPCGRPAGPAALRPRYRAQQACAVVVGFACEQSWLLVCRFL